MKLTSLQEAYLIGRNKKENLGNTACHVYLEFDGRDIQREKLQSAWSEVIKKHEAMRMKINPDATADIMEAPFSDRIFFLDFSGKKQEFIKEELIKIRQSFSHRKMHTEYGQTAGLFLIALPENRNKLIFDLDLLMCDVYGFQVILDDFAEAYSSDILTYPILPVLEQPAVLHSCTYTALTSYISGADSEKLKYFLKSRNLGIFEALLTFFGKAVSEISENKRFIVNVPVFHTEKRKGIVKDNTELLFVPQFWDIKTDILHRISETGKQLTELRSHTRENRKPSGNFPAAVFSYVENELLISPLFESMFGDVSYMISQTPEVLIDCQVFETNHGLRLDWVYPENVFDNKLISECFQHFVYYIKEVIKYE